MTHKKGKNKIKQAMKKGMQEIDNGYGEDCSKENKCTQNASMKEVKRNNQDEKN